VSAGGGVRLARGLRTLPVAAAGLAALAVAFFAAVAPVLIHGFLGDEFHGAVAVLRSALPAAIPLAAFYAARPTLDALQETPVISRLLLVCLAVEIALTYGTAEFLAPTTAAVLGLTAAAALLGGLAYAALLRAVPA
jgi:O-antigen/teichoic acid export membrane protein